MQYRIHVLFLLALVLVSAPAMSASDSVTLVVGGEKPFLHVSPVLIDGVVYASLPALSTVSAKYDTDTKRKKDGQEVRITSAKGEKLSCRARLVNGELMVPISDIASQLGAVADWNESTKTLSLRARVENVEFDGAQFRVNLSYPVSHEVVWWKGANKLILDMQGVYLPANLPTSNSTAVTIRAAMQKDGFTGRIVLDMPCAVKWKVNSPSKTSAIVISVSGLSSPQIAPTVKPAVPPAPGTEVLPLDATQQPETPPVNITNIDYRKDGPRRLEVYVDAGGPVEYQTSMTRDPDELIVDIPNAVLAQEFGDIPVGHEILQGIRVEQPSEKAVRLTMDLVRIVGFDLSQDESQNRLTIALQMPKGAGGALSGKTIVIDPGHGGRATGATGLDGRFEKESNLAISKRVRKLLLDAGVCAILTRSTDKSLDGDTKSDLAKRAEFAARHSANAFLSIHSNSIAGPRCPSGLETYYHGHDMSGRALAYCVHSEVTRAGLLPDLRVRSDFMLYQTGLGVLRNAVERFGIPSALIEVGYVKHAEDLAKIRDPKFQQKVAEAIVRGLRLYFEGNPPARPEKSEPGTQEVSKPARTEKPSAEPAASPKLAETKKPSASRAPERPGVK